MKRRIKKPAEHIIEWKTKKDQDDNFVKSAEYARFNLTNRDLKKHCLNEYKDTDVYSHLKSVPANRLKDLGIICWMKSFEHGYREEWDENNRLEKYLEEIKKIKIDEALKPSIQPSVSSFPKYPSQILLSSFDKFYDDIINNKCKDTISKRAMVKDLHLYFSKFEVKDIKEFLKKNILGNGKKKVNEISSLIIELEEIEKVDKIEAREYLQSYGKDGITNTQRIRVIEWLKQIEIVMNEIVENAKAKRKKKNVK